MYQTYSPDVGLLRYSQRQRKEKEIYVYINLHAISDCAGFISLEYDILRISNWSGLSRRSIKESLRWLMKNGFVEKWGDKWHVKSKYSVREMIGYEETGQVRLRLNKIKEKFNLWKANAIQYVKDTHIKIQATIRQKNEKLITTHNSKGVPGSNNRPYRSCSYRQAEVITGKSKSYLHKQAQIQDVADYYSRWCRDFDELNVRSVKLLNELIEANDEWQPSMFVFDKRYKIFRKRKSDAIYSKSEILFRKTPKKYII